MSICNQNKHTIKSYQQNDHDQFLEEGIEKQHNIQNTDSNVLAVIGIFLKVADH